MHPDVIASVWDDPRNVDTLTRLWTEGKSAAQIASILSVGAPEPVSRSAVLGKAHRLKLKSHGPNPVKREKPAKSVSPTGKKGRQGNPGHPSALSIVRRAEDRRRVPFRDGRMPPEDEGVDVTGLVGFRDRRVDKQCAWIFGEPTSDAMCCGKPVKEGSQWCEAHHARVYSGRPSL